VRFLIVMAGDIIPAITVSGDAEEAKK